jgi:hypothetical protein
MTKFNAISIVAPHGTNISKGIKTLEVRSWKLTIPLHSDLVIVENKRYLTKENEIDLDAKAVAIVKIKKVRDFVKEDIKDACATYWSNGYYSWELYDIRELETKPTVPAKLNIYEIEI